MSYEEVMNLAGRRGYFMRSGEAYPNTPAGFWDYGPLGVSFRYRFIELWRTLLVKRDEMVEIDTAQIMPKSVFLASGHLAGFTDPIVQCANCKSIYRADRLLEEKTGEKVPEKLADDKYDALFLERHVVCPNCKSELKGTRRFNMMFRVGIGPQEEEAYLRPETCQGIFVDFPFLFKTQRIKLPKGFAQVGKSFRNESAPRQGLLRQREFYQAEIEVMFNPKTVESTQKFDAAQQYKLNLSQGDEPKLVSGAEAVAQGLVPNKLVAYYLYLIQSFYEILGIDNSKVRLRKLNDEEKAFYSAAAFDLEVKTSLGWVELVACNYRSDYDLKRHGEISGSDFTVEDGGEKVLPHVFELSMGIDRSLYAILENAYRVGEGRTYLALPPSLAPVQVAVFPLVSKDGLQEIAHQIYRSLLNQFEAMYDESGSIGRRYARSDEAGIPFCVTVDHETLDRQTVTIRYRDQKTQERIATGDLEAHLQKLISKPKIQ